MFSIKKPPDWNQLPLYKKVEIYSKLIGSAYSPYVDKLKAKEIVKKLCDDRIHVAPVIRILKSCNDVSEKDINSGHLIKAAHGSGWFIDMALIQDLNQIKKMLFGWNQIFSTTENQYRFVKPRFFIEDKIVCKYKGKTGNAHDAKIHCFHGQPKIIFIRKDATFRNYYDTSWNPLMPLEFEFDKPENLDEILSLASVLSAQFEYVRVDFYMGVDGIYFSEFTFTPHGGKQKLSDEVERAYGRFF